MKYVMLAVFLLCSLVGRTQEGETKKEKAKLGKLYFEWGYNRVWHSKSDIHLKGNGYDYTLKDVSASDSPADFDPSVYFNIGKFSIPQFNVRLGYNINEKYSVSIGYDHMKYVLDNSKNGKISGYITEEAIEDGVLDKYPEVANYVGEYENDEIYLSQRFIKYEHTDGLNYVRINIDRRDQLWRSSNQKLAVSVMNGLGGGPVVPWTDYTHLSGKRHTNRLHCSGYALSINTGVKADFWDKFYLQSNAVGGFVNLPWVEAAEGYSDVAAQQFFFFQFNVVAGVYINTNRILKR